MCFILMHLDAIPASYLALLPLSFRKTILNRVPVADVCQFIEDTPFANGLALEDYWRDNRFPSYMGLRQDLQEVCKAKWGPTEFAKACFYSSIAEKILNLTTREVALKMFEGTNMVTRSLSFMHFLPSGMEVSTLLFAIRSFASETRKCNFTFPPRYTKFDVNIRNEVNAAVEGFKGRPHLLKLGFGMTDRKPNGFMLDFFSDLEYLEVHISTKRRFKVVVNLVEQATNLKFLSIEYRHGNALSTELTKLPTSSLHTLILTKLVMMQDALHQFLQCFLCIPCDHPQKLRLEEVTIKCASGKREYKTNQQLPTISYWPDLELTDRRYLQLKTVEMANCTIKTAELVLQWPVAKEETNLESEHKDVQKEGHKRNSKRKCPVSSKSRSQRSSKRPRKK